MIEVGRLIHPSHDVVLQLGELTPHLTNRHSGGADYERIARIVDSPTTALLIARSLDEDDQLPQYRPNIVGSMVVSTVFGTLSEKAALEDFIVVPEAQGTGAAQMLWDEMINWRTRRRLNQMRFTSNPSLERAHGFYLKNNCEIIAEGDTTLFVHNL